MQRTQGGEQAAQQESVSPKEVDAVVLLVHASQQHRRPLQRDHREPAQRIAGMGVRGGGWGPPSGGCRDHALKRRHYW